jgi:hypothetical protein
MLNPSLNLNRLVTAVWMFCLACVSWADPTAHQGIYLKTAQGYTELVPVENMDGLEYDYSRHLLKLPVIEGEELELTLVIHQQDFSPHWAGYDVRDMESPAAGQRLKPVKVEELAENKYQVTLKLAARNQHFLLIDTGCCRQSQVYGVALTDTHKALARIFADESQNPVSAEYVLANILRGSPDDEQVKALHAQWQARIKEAEAMELFGRIESAWEDYEQASQPARRLEALEVVQALGQRYLDDYAGGSKQAEVKKYLDTAAKKLNI